MNANELTDVVAALTQRVVALETALVTVRAQLKVVGSGRRDNGREAKHLAGSMSDQIIEAGQIVARLMAAGVAEDDIRVVNPNKRGNISVLWPAGVELPSAQDADAEVAEDIDV